MSDTPTPDQFGRFRVAETVDGKTRHYSTKRFLPGVHKIVEGPDAAASFANGQERPPKFPAPAKPSADSRTAQPATATPTADSPKGADK